MLTRIPLPLLLPIAALLLLAVGGPVASLTLTLLILLGAIVAHELGHLVVARRLGIRVNTFAAGFGPILGRREWRGIDWQLRMLPLGGFVSLHGEAAGSSEDPDSFAMAGRARRAVVMVAGVAVNLAVALGTLWLVSLAALYARGSGFVPLAAWQAAMEILGVVVGETARLIGEWLPNAAGAPLDLPLVGIPGMAWAVDRTAAQGPIMLGILVALLNGSMAVLNLLPVPPTDGGRILLDLLSDPRRGETRLRRVSEYAGLALFLGLGIAVTGIDLVRLALDRMPVQ